MTKSMVGQHRQKLHINKAITIHSYKGGTGKSNLSANTAVTLAKRGWNVVLFDFDFRAPSLSALFQQEKVNYWLNDWLAQRCELDEALVDFSQKYQTQGSFLVGFTNPSGHAINEMTVNSLNEEWQAKVLQLVLDGKDQLFEKHNVHFQIFDTSPGFALSSINAILASDELILVIKMDQLDIAGTLHLIRGVYDQTLGKKPQIIVNKVPCSLLGTEEDYYRLRDDISSKLGVEVIGIIPCFCEVLENMGQYLFVIQRPEHSFTRFIENLSSHFETVK
jgi:MinD-like ATPase involved in chromosome partitioning or flagellar assembly